MEDPDAQQSQPTSGQRPSEWDPFVRQVAIIVLILCALLLMRGLRPMLDMLAVTGLFILILSYPVNAVRARTKMSYPVATLVVFVPIALVAIWFYGVLLQWSLENLRAFINELQAGVSETPGLDLLIARFVGGTSVGARFIENLAGDLTGRLSFAAGFITITGVSLLLAFLFILEMPSNLAHSFQRMSDASQRELGILLDRLASVWTSWLRSTGISSIIVGVTTALELWLFGIPYAGILGVIAGFLNLIPTIGPLIAYILIIFVTYTQGSTRLSLSPGALTLLVWAVNVIGNQVIRLYIYPRLAGKALHLPVFLVILGIVVALVLWGVIGVILVVPLLGTVGELLRYVLAKINRREPYPGEELRAGFWAQELGEQ
jgi:predicted PurR-regulated permease PerM